MTPAAGELEASADDLFISLAQESGDEAIGVILSGGGSQRSLGVRAIRQAGGTTFAQYPGSARFPNMPISAIDTGCVDFVLRPNEIARELTRIGRRQPVLRQSDRIGPISILPAASVTPMEGCAVAGQS